MAGTGPQLLVVVVVVVWGSLLPATAATSDLSISKCKVKPTIFRNVTDHKAMETTFWANIKNVHPFKEVILRKAGGFRYLDVQFNVTHATVSDVAMDTRLPVSEEAVSGLVCAGWRRFHLVLAGGKNVTLTDDFNTTWIDRQLNYSISSINITVDNFDASCSTATPMWHVDNGTSMGMTLPAAQPHEDLHFTLLTNTENCDELQLFLGGHSIAQGKVAPQHPFHLRLKRTPGAVPNKAEIVEAWLTAKAVVDTRENVIEIGGSSSELRLQSSCPMLVLQHLGHPMCPLPPTADENESDHHHCGSNKDLLLAIMGTEAASIVVIFYCLGRVIRMVFAERTQEQARTKDTSQSHPASGEPVYEEIDEPSA